MHTYTASEHLVWSSGTRATPDLRPGDAHSPAQRRENMVGVDMVLAEFAKFKHGLYKYCDIVV